MASTSELQAIKDANPNFSIPGLDTGVGLQIAETSLKSPQTLTGTPGIYYSETQKIVVVYQDGITLSGIDLTGLSVMVQADNVTVSNCAFDATSGSFALKVYPGYANATIDHCSFDGLKLDRGFEDFIVSQGTNTTITNSTFVNAPRDAIYIENGTVSHNAISGGGYNTGAHPDAIWIGKTTGAVTISDNVIDWRNPADSRAETNNAIRVTGENGNVNDVTVTGNVILGGSTSVFISDGPTQTHPTVGTVTNVQVTGNIVDHGRWSYLNMEYRPSDLVYADNVLATGPSPAMAVGSNPEIATPNHITGSAAVDSLSGSAQADFIAGGNGGDWISAGGGNDVILSGAGHDYLTGGAGADYFMYTSVADVGIGAGCDLIMDFQVGLDKIYLAGLQGLPPLAADESWHFVGSKYFTGRPLEIRAYVSGSNNTIVAFDLDGDMTTDMEIALSGKLNLTAGDFLITITTPETAEAASFFATAPVATITGTAAGNTLNGTASSEEIYGLSGGDIINGGGGDDVIVGGADKDLLTGGAGRDRFVFESAADSKVGGTTRDFIQDFTHGQDVIDLSAIDANRGTTAYDTFSWIGTSSFSGAAGQLRYQFVGTYTVVYADTNGDKVADFEIGVAGNQYLVSSDFLFATVLPVAAAKMGWASVGETPNLDILNTIAGSSVADNLKGSSGADRITGGQGSDWISAGTGDDVIQGGAGRDYLTGGAGSDTFYFANVNESGDRITDFEAGRDKIYLADLDLPAGAQGASWSWLGAGNYTGHALELRAYQSGAVTFVTADLDGDMKTDIWLELTGQVNVSGSDVIVANGVIASPVSSAPAISSPANLIGAAAGADALSGVGGVDHFVFDWSTVSRTGTGRDVITDFTQGEDVLDLSRIDGSLATAAGDAFDWIGISAFSGAAGQLRASTYSYGTVVQGDTNGDKVADFEILLTKQLELTSHDFLL
jgi:Ca2+-binding RTX toxin-like protein